MIYMKDNIISNKYVKKTKPSWEKNGFNVELYDACTPKNQNSYINPLYKLNFDRIHSHRPREFSETEIAIWYSHFKLWMHSFIFKENIIIVEHDCLMVIKINDDYFSSNKSPIITLCHGDARTFPCAKHCQCEDCSSIRSRRRSTIGGGYFLTPEAAGILISWALQDSGNKGIRINSDGHIHALSTFYKKKGYLTDDPKYSYQYTDLNLGTTIDHGKNVVGESWKVDYANI